MPELISKTFPRARKYHRCDLCNQKIEPGEVYESQFCKYEGQVYKFRSHDVCRKISSKLWGFIDPDEGMTEEAYQEGVNEYCWQFVCPHCQEWDFEGEECRSSCEPHDDCKEKILERLANYPLKQEKTKYGKRWVEAPKDGDPA
jgi:predicted RNA-binding Zn-ribbon protein involved in translation (DUF1610 family)